MGLFTGAVPVEDPVAGAEPVWLPAEGVPGSVEEHPVRTAASRNGTASRRMTAKLSDHRTRRVGNAVSRVTRKAHCR
ncbi:hypothetical protein GCM10017774_23550 [Lentzea cavernae]|uniref:Uncharacterized protein n=1 Tax=Lentzea cavernae TaxID=2020703 RepID=A0ABQ3MC83_9PSEU|nr:hypothetical protein GCM10017774_23550 [Lentzea cavernae]